MKLYQRKQLKICFSILCPDNSKSLLQNTVNSIKSRYPSVPFYAVCDNQATSEDIAVLKKICPIFKGKSTISSLINVGMRHATADWVFTIMAGTYMNWLMDEKFGFYIESERDVVYPISNGKTNFIEATLNGLLINKKTFQEVGDFIEDGELEHIKSEWALKAIDHGCKFKAIMGAKLC